MAQQPKSKLEEEWEVIEDGSDDWEPIEEDVPANYEAAPIVEAPVKEPPRTLYEHAFNAPKPVTDAATRFAESLTPGKTPEGGVLDALGAIPDVVRNLWNEPKATLKGFVGGGAEGAASMLSPVNVATLGRGKLPMMAARYLGAAQAAHGGKEVLAGNTAEGLGDIGFGALMGFSGIRRTAKATTPKPAAKDPVSADLKPKQKLLGPGPRFSVSPEGTVSEGGMPRRSTEVPYRAPSTPTRTTATPSTVEGIASREIEDLNRANRARERQTVTDNGYDVPDNPVARELEEGRLADEAAWRLTQEPTVGPATRRFTPTADPIGNSDLSMRESLGSANPTRPISPVGRTASSPIEVVPDINTRPDLPNAQESLDDLDIDPDDIFGRPQGLLESGQPQKQLGPGKYHVTPEGVVSDVGEPPLTSARERLGGKDPLPPKQGPVVIVKDRGPETVNILKANGYTQVGTTPEGFPKMAQSTAAPVQAPVQAPPRVIPPAPLKSRVPPNNPVAAPVPINRNNTASPEEMEQILAALRSGKGTMIPGKGINLDISGGAPATPPPRTARPISPVGRKAPTRTAPVPPSNPTRFAPAPRDVAATAPNKPKPTAKFSMWEEGLPGDTPTPKYDLDNTGDVNYDGSTVGAETLRKLGIAIPKTPPHVPGKKPADYPGARKQIDPDFFEQAKARVAAEKAAKAVPEKAAPPVTARSIRDQDYEKLWNNTDESSYSAALERQRKSISEELDPEVIKDNWHNWDIEYQERSLHGNADEIETAGTLRDEALDRARRLQAQDAPPKKKAELKIPEDVLPPEPAKARASEWGNARRQARELGIDDKQYKKIGDLQGAIAAAGRKAEPSVLSKTDTDMKPRLISPVKAPVKPTVEPIPPDGGKGNKAGTIPGKRMSMDERAAAARAERLANGGKAPKRGGRLGKLVSDEEGSVGLPSRQDLDDFMESVSGTAKSAGRKIGKLFSDETGSIGDKTNNVPKVTRAPGYGIDNADLNVEFPDGRTYTIYKDSSSGMGQWEVTGLPDGGPLAFTKKEMIEKLATLDESAPYVSKYTGKKQGTIADALGRVKKLATDETGSINLGGDTPKTPTKPRPKSVIVQGKNSQKIADKVRELIEEGYKPAGTSEQGFPRLVWPQRQSWGREAYELSRGLMSVDPPFVTSAAFRQGLPMLVTNPAGWLKGVINAAKSYSSEKLYDKINSEMIKANPYMQRRAIDGTGRTKLSIAEELGLAVTDINNFTNREEGITSRLAEMIPGYGRHVRANNRAFTSFLNTTRAHSLKKFGDQAKLDSRSLFGQNIPGRDIETDLKFGKELVEAINTLTGRGKLSIDMPGISKVTGKGRELDLSKATQILTDAFFSPKLMASRIRMLNPSTYINADPFTRKLYVKGLASAVGTWYTISKLGEMAGGEIVKDPNSADFGKIKFGDTRFDPGAGLQQYLVLFSRIRPDMLTLPDSVAYPLLGDADPGGGKFTSSTTGLTSELGKGFKPLTEGGLTQDLFVNKMHPTAKLAWDMMHASEDRKVHLGDRILQLALPMMTADLAEVAREDPTLFFPVFAASAIGMGASTYQGGEQGPSITPLIDEKLGTQLEEFDMSIPSND